MKSTVVALVCLAVVAVGLWSLWRVPALPVSQTPSLERDVVGSTRPQAGAGNGAVAGGGEPVRKAPRQVHHDSESQAEIRFDLSLPKNQRKFCGECDPYKRDLAGHFDADQQSLIERAAQYSAYTEGEVWRVLSGSSDRMVQFESIVRPLIREYEAKSLYYFSCREKLGRELVARGSFEEYSPDFPPHLASDSSKFIDRAVSGGVAVYRIATLSPGLSTEFDEALSRRMDAEALLTSGINEIIRRYHAEDVR